MKPTPPDLDPDSQLSNPPTSDAAHTTEPGAYQAQVQRHNPREEDLADQTNYLPPLKASLAFIAIGCSTALAVVDGAIVANSVSQMSADLGHGELSAWIGRSPLSSALTDLYSHRLQVLRSY